MSATTRREAAAILRRLVEALPRPAGMAAYLRGFADGLEAKPPRRRRTR